MINEPAVEKLVEKVGSRYALCVVAAKRARQLIDAAESRGEEQLKEKPITMAANEIMSGRVTCSKD